VSFAGAKRTLHGWSHREWALIVGMFVLLAVVPSRGDPAVDRNEMNGGYYLLHHLSEDEAKVPLLLLVKHHPPAISDFADAVSKTAKDTLAALDRFQQNAPSLQFDKNPLPEIEQETRDSIKAEKQHQLLFGTTDSNFVRAFLVSQIEACTYGNNLCKVLAKDETSADRTETLEHLSVKWLAVRDRAYRLLGDY
jgi:hypothetical protein